MTSPLYEEYVRRFPPAPKYAEDDMCFAARLHRLKKQVQGTEPFEFGAVMEHVYSPGPDLMFIDRKGGTLIATMESSLYDEWGNRRENFGLADLFGVDYVGQGYGTQILVPETPALRKQFGRFVCFESPG